VAVAVLVYLRRHLGEVVKLPLWIVLTLSIVFLAMLIKITYELILECRKPKWSKFTKVDIDGATWQWKWDGNEVKDLKPFCLCGSEVEIIHEKIGPMEAIKTICPICSQVVQYTGVRDIAEQTRKKITYLRDTGQWAFYPSIP